MFVTIATLDSFTATVANTSGALLSASTTFPLIVIRFCWSFFFLSERFPADAVWAVKASRRTTAIKRNVFKIFHGFTFIKLKI